MCHNLVVSIVTCQAYSHFYVVLNDIYEFDYNFHNRMYECQLIMKNHVKSMDSVTLIKVCNVYPVTFFVKTKHFSFDRTIKTTCEMVKKHVSK